MVSDSLWPHGLQPVRLLCPWDFPGKNTAVVCHALLQRVFLTQGSNLHLSKVRASVCLSVMLSSCLWAALTLLIPDVASNKEPACQCKRHKRLEFDPYVGKIPWRKKWQPTAVFLPGKSHGQRSLADYSPWGHKESETAEQLRTACTYPDGLCSK